MDYAVEGPPPVLLVITWSLEGQDGWSRREKDLSFRGSEPKAVVG